jgi:membrane peptidoglycan carboxypeptidase
MPQKRDFYVRWIERGESRPKKGRLKRTIIGLLAAGFLLAGILAVAATIFFATTVRDLPDPNNIATRRVEQSTKFYDRTGTHLLYELHGDERRTVVDLPDIAKDAVNATISVEDKYFYQHKGYRITSLIRAVLVDIVTGSRSQGGSTITQQLVKNAILTNQKSLGRKIRELILASEIERRFSKDDILKMYFNEIPYGSNIYGIEAASENFFGKKAKDLTLAESALLAALPQSPTYYSPWGTHRDDLLARWKLILDLMVQQGYATKDQADAAKKTDILKEITPKREAIVAPHFVFYVEDQLVAKYGEQAVETGGMSITTTLDFDKQADAEKAVADHIKDIEKFGGSNASLVSIDPKTGQILAMVGSRDYFDAKDDGAVNVALQPRQPGSSIKPLVYLTSFVKGYTPSTVLMDANTVFPTPQGPYAPKDYKLNENGPVTVRQAIGGSLNTPAVKMLYLTGIDNVIDMAEKFGYTTWGDRSRFGLALVLGGGEVTLLEHTAAYGVFANEGVRHPTVSILKVADAKNQTLEEWKPEDGTRVVDSELVRNLTDILHDDSARTFVFGTNDGLTLPDRQVAAKTGTTNDVKDAWTMGFTPSLVAGVWVGNNQPKAMQKSSSAVMIWNEYMRLALKGTPVETFTPPQPIVTGKPILDGVKMPGVTVTVDKISGKLATDFTPPETREDRTYGAVHDILFYINKDDPRGATPPDPADPMYQPFEDSAAHWATENNIAASTPPTEYDDVHMPQDKPTVNFVNPYDSGAVGTDFSANVNASSRRGVVRVVFALDGTKIGESDGGGNSFHANLSIPAGTVVGFHTLTATAEDDLFNSASASINVNYNQ